MFVQINVIEVGNIQYIVKRFITGAQNKNILVRAYFLYGVICLLATLLLVFMVIREEKKEVEECYRRQNDAFFLTDGYFYGNIDKPEDKIIYHSFDDCKDKERLYLWVQFYNYSTNATLTLEEIEEYLAVEFDGRQRRNYKDYGNEEIQTYIEYIDTQLLSLMSKEYYARELAEELGFLEVQIYARANWEELTREELDVIILKMFPDGKEEAKEETKEETSLTVPFICKFVMGYLVILLIGLYILVMFKKGVKQGRCLVKNCYCMQNEAFYITRIYKKWDEKAVSNDTYQSYSKCMSKRVLEKWISLYNEKSNGNLSLEDIEEYLSKEYEDDGTLRLYILYRNQEIQKYIEFIHECKLYNRESIVS